MNAHTQKHTPQQVREMIEQAIIIKAKTYPFNDGKKVKPFREMTDLLNEQLYLLLTRARPSEDKDWDSILWSLQDFMKALLVLLAKPGILQQLQTHYQSTAAQDLELLMSFFNIISTDYTHALLDYTLVGYCEKDINQLQILFNHYNFINRDANGGGFFHDFLFNKQKEQKAIAYFNEHFNK